MNYGPISFSEQMYTNYFNMKPSEVKGTINDAVQFNKRYLYTKIYSVFNFKNFPEVWDMSWFRFWLFHCGSINILETKKYGWIPMPYGIKELNIFYKPIKTIVSSPYLDNDIESTIGKDAEIIYLFDDYYSIDDLVTKYATKLASIDKSIDINLMNSNLSMLYEANDKKEADSFKEAYGKATEGSPIVTVKKGMVGEDKLKNLIPNVASNYLVNDLLDSRRTIVNEFLTEIGIKNANYDKKERLNSQEVNQNNDETSAIVTVMLWNMKKGFKLLRDISGLKCDVELNYDYIEEVNNNENDIMGD